MPIKNFQGKVVRMKEKRYLGTIMPKWVRVKNLKGPNCMWSDQKG
jgi:hypothetical protein